MCYTQLFMWATIWSELESASLAGEDSDDWQSLDSKSANEVMSADARMSWWSDTNPVSMTRIFEGWSVMMRSSRWSGSFRVGDLTCCSKPSVSSTSSDPGLIEQSSATGASRSPHMRRRYGWYDALKLVMERRDWEVGWTMNVHCSDAGSTRRDSQPVHPHYGDWPSVSGSQYKRKTVTCNIRSPSIVFSISKYLVSESTRTSSEWSETISWMSAVLWALISYVGCRGWRTGIAFQVATQL